MPAVMQQLHRMAHGLSQKPAKEVTGFGLKGKYLSEIGVWRR